jgi:hypothetical protein
LATTTTIEDVFRGRIFRIPDYQRGYAWEAKQWDELLQDLEFLPAGRNHFTGTLVLRASNHDQIKIKDESGGSHELFDVVDGQQRLATLVILLNAIRIEMEKLDGLNKLAEGIREKYLWVIDDLSNPQPKLLLNQDCRAYFTNNILGLNPGLEGPTIQSHQRLQDCQFHITTYLDKQRKRNPEAYVDWLRELYFKISLHLTTLLYEAENEIEAGVLFETMNNRGKPLAELDKVKNHLQYIASNLETDQKNDLVQRINETWTHIFERLMAAGLGDQEREDQLLRAHWLMIYDYQPDNWKQSNSIKTRFDLKKYPGNLKVLYQEIKNYLVTLLKAATAFCDLYKPDYPGAFNEVRDQNLRRAIVKSSQRLVRQGVRAVFYPVLLAARINSPDNGETYLKTVDLLEKFSFRVYLWRGWRPNSGQSRLYRAGYQFYQHRNPDLLLRDLTWASSHYCDNNQFAEMFDRMGVNWYQWNGLKYFLYEYELYHAEEYREPPGITWKALWEVKRNTIEHILPQTPSHTYWQERFTPEQIQRWTNDLGNLTLTYDNSSLGNKPFPEKRGRVDLDNCYASSNIFIEQELARHEDWTEAQIIERREKLKTWAIQRWFIKSPELVIDLTTKSAFDLLVDKARGLNVAEGLIAFHQLAVIHGLYPYISNQSISYGTWYDVRQRALTIYPYESYFWIIVRLENLAKFPNMTRERADEIFGGRRIWWIESNQIADLMKRIDQVFTEIKAEK